MPRRSPKASRSPSPSPSPPSKKSLPSSTDDISVATPTSNGFLKSSLTKNIAPNFRSASVIAANASRSTSPLAAFETLVAGSLPESADLVADDTRYIYQNQTAEEPSILGSILPDGCDHPGLTGGPNEEAHPKIISISPLNPINNHRVPALVWPTHIFKPNSTPTPIAQSSKPTPITLGLPFWPTLNTLPNPIPMLTNGTEFQQANSCGPPSFNPKNQPKPTQPINHKPASLINITNAPAQLPNYHTTLISPVAPAASTQLPNSPIPQPILLTIQPGPASPPPGPISNPQTNPASKPHQAPAPQPDPPKTQTRLDSTTLNQSTENVTRSPTNDKAPTTSQNTSNPSRPPVSYAQIINNQHTSAQPLGFQQTESTNKSFNFDGAKDS